MRKKALIILLIAISYTASATKYYVSSSSGDDAVSRDGMSEASAWKTLSKINGKTFLAGDEILLKKGDVWREMLVVPSSGNSGAYLIFSNYGSGANPRILGSKQATTWTNQGGNVWKSAISLSNPSTYSNIFFVANSTFAVTWGVRKTSTGSLAADYDWTWSSNAVYVYSATDPGSKYNSIEAPQRTFSVDLNDKNYIEINGIDMRYSTWGGVLQHTDNGSYTGFTMRNCESAYHGDKNGYGYGVYLCYNNTLIENCVFHDLGRRGVSINNYSNYDISNIIIQKCTFYNGYHTTGPDIESGTSTSGDLSNVTVRYCLIYDEPNRDVGWGVNSVFVQGPHGGSGEVHDFYFYCNIVKFPHGNSVSLERVYGSHIYNNTFYGHNPNWTPSYSFYADTYCTDIELKNNIFYSLLPNETQGNGAFLVTYGMSDSEVDANYNLYYRPTNNLRIVNANGSAFYMNQIANIRSSKGWEINSPVPADAKFLSTTDYHLQAGSPAIGKGVHIALVTTDFDGNSFGGTPNIGCFASYSSNSPPAVNVTSPANSATFTAPASVTINASASDPDGTVSKVEFFNGTVKLGEDSSMPYSFAWNNVGSGNYSLTAVVTDNQNATAASTGINITVSVVTAVELPGKEDNDLFNIYPNPNNGQFYIELSNSQRDETEIITIYDLTGRSVYNGTISSGETTKQFDLSNVASGFYIMKLNGNQRSANKKFYKN